MPTTTFPRYSFLEKYIQNFFSNDNANKRKNSLNENVEVSSESAPGSAPCSYALAYLDCFYHADAPHTATEPSNIIRHKPQLTKTVLSTPLSTSYGFKEQQNESKSENFHQTATWLICSILHLDPRKNTFTAKVKKGTKVQSFLVNRESVDGTVSMRRLWQESRSDTQKSHFQSSLTAL